MLFLVDGFLLAIPVFNVLQNLLLVNVRNVVMRSQVFGEVRLARTRFASNRDFERLKAARFTKFVLHKLNVGGQTALTVPVKIVTAFCSIFTFSSFRGNKDRGRFRFDVQHHELSPVEVQIEGSLFGVDWRVLNRDVN